MILPCITYVKRFRKENIRDCYGTCAEDKSFFTEDSLKKMGLEMMMMTVIRMLEGGIDDL